MNKLILLYPCPQAVRQELEAAVEGRLQVCVLSPEDLEPLLSDAEYIIGEPDMAQVQAAKKLRVLQMTWAGADRYTNAPGFPEGVTLCNASGAFGVTIAEHALALALSLCRRLPDYLQQQSEGLWIDCGCEKSLSGAAALILGTGDLGAEVAKRCRGLGMKTLGVNRSGRVAGYFDEVHPTQNLDVLLPRADVVFGCLPDTPQTRRLLNARTLALLPEDAIVVNVGRGSLIDSDALAQRLAAGKLWGAGLDVTAPEPLPAGHPLRGMRNVILTPHVAGVGFGHLRQTEDAIWRICVQNVRQYLSGQPLTNVVNRKSGTRVHTETYAPKPPLMGEVAARKG